MALAAASTQRGWLVLTAGRHTEPVPHPPPLSVVAQNRLDCVQVGVLAVALPPAVHPGYIGVSAPRGTRAMVPAPARCQFGLKQPSPEECVPTINCIEGSAMHSW